ncbi:MAG: cupin domain-containing protein [Verrucomicrobiales bacterium]
MNQKTIINCLVGVTLSLAPISGQAPHEEMPGARLYSAGEIKWEAAPPSLPPGAKVAVLEGDPAKEGPFVMRVLLPDRYRVPLHTHPKTERVTVISGTFKIAMGDQPDLSKPQTMKAGAFGFWPAGMKHTAWAEGETIIQVHGVGPWAINYVNPADDPRNAKKPQ